MVGYLTDSGVPAPPRLDLVISAGNHGRMTWYSSPAARDWIGAPVSGDALPFHRALPGYAPTRLVAASALARELGVGEVFVKDEASRFGLGAFKVLGASWACHRVLSRRPGVMVVTATEGNHGRAVARMAAYFGVDATVFVPDTTVPAAVERIAREGAKVVWVDGDYSVAVREAADFTAAADGRALVQDTAWPGYEEVPAWIVAGYETLLAEVDDQLGGAPALVATPAGVGSLAEAVVRHYRAPGAPRPAVLVVEPDTAACVVTSLVEGRPVAVPTGDTVMAGLNCGIVSSAAWPVLHAGCDAAVTVTDADTLRAVADLDRVGVRAGPSGAAALAGVRAVLTDPARRAALSLPADAVVVLLSTEGRP